MDGEHLMKEEPTSGTEQLISECQIKKEVADVYETSDWPEKGTGCSDDLDNFINTAHIKTEPPDYTDEFQTLPCPDVISEATELTPDNIKSEPSSNADDEGVKERAQGDNKDENPAGLYGFGNVSSASENLGKEEISAQDVTNPSSTSNLFPVALYKNYQSDPGTVSLPLYQDINTLGYKINLPDIKALCDSAMAEEQPGKSDKGNVAPPKKEYKYKCTVCSKSFPKKNKLDRHVRTHTGEKPFKCPTCDRAFADNRNLKTHMRIHSGEKPYKCTYCGKAFTQGSSLQIHIRVHTNERPYKCTACEKTFRQSRNLQLHTRTHTGEKPHKCPDCGEFFRSSSNLQSHYRTHTGEKPFTCIHCGKSFAQSNVLQSHLRTHTGEKPYRCPVCLQNFGGRGYLQAHMGIHNATKEKPFECPVCQMGFSLKFEMQDHSLTHTGIKSHHCPLCNKAFTQKSSVKKHLKTHEEETVPDYHHLDDDPRIVKIINISTINNIDVDTDGSGFNPTNSQDSTNKLDIPKP